MQEIKQILDKTAYYDEACFENEKEKIFETQWQFVCMEEELNEPKSYILKDIGNTPIIVVNDKNEINAFVNICSHRGMTILRGDEKIESSIICPYHNWNFSLKGELKGLPQSKEFTHKEKKCLGLKKAQCEVWNGLVFVNLDLKAQSIRDILNPIKNRILPYDNISELKSNDGYKYIINANWKIFVENYMDVYHLFHIHKESLKEYDHKNSHNEFVNNQWLFYQPLSQKGKSSSSWWNGYMGDIKSFNGQKGAYVSMLFPNFGITATENLCMFIHIKPLSATQTEIEVFIKSNYGSKKFKNDLVYDYRDGKKSKSELLKKPDVMNEDIYVCEMIQKNIKSPHFKVNALAQDLEKPLFEYQSIIKKLLNPKI